MTSQDLTVMALLGAGAIAGGGLLALSGRGVERPEVWYRLSWPRGLATDNVTGFLRHLAGDHRRHAVALEIAAIDGQLSYRIGVAKRHSEDVLAALSSFLPGVATEVIDEETIAAPTHAWQMTISSSHRVLRTSEPANVARSITTALAGSASRQAVVFQWLLGPRLKPESAPSKGEAEPAASWADLLKQTVAGSTVLNAEARRSLTEKIEEPGFRAVCRVGVVASSDNQAKATSSRLLTALRTAEAPGVTIGLRIDDPDRLAAARPSRSWPVAINVRELTGLCGWPLGDKAYPGVARTGARLLPVGQSVARRGRILGESTLPGTARQLALSAKDSLQHLHVLGPTGVGKSTLLLNLAVQDIAAGRGVVVVDPKGDLVDDILQRVPEERRDDVVVLDPADETRPVGLNVLSGGDRLAELVADQVLAVFHDLYRENWGPRTQDILHAALLTLANRPGMTLCALPVLLSNQGFRRKAVAALDDEIALKPFWAWFESLSEGERQQAIAPVMNKLRAFLLRPRMRALIGQAEPAFNVESVFTQRKVLLVSLAKGLIGPEAAALLGSLVVSQLWQTAQGRVRLPVGQRSPVMIYIDEFQDYLHLPTDIADVLAQARGLGVSLTLAHQHLAQLPAAMRSAVLANARSRVCFQLGSEDARAIAATSTELDALDLESLGRFETYMSLVADGNVTPFASAQTMKPAEVTSSCGELRSRSRERYGRDLGAIETDLAQLVRGEQDTDEHPIGRRRRS